MAQPAVGSEQRVVHLAVVADLQVVKAGSHPHEASQQGLGQPGGG